MQSSDKVYPDSFPIASGNPAPVAGSITHLLHLLDRPIAFHRCFVTLTGSITAALMLSQAIYWQKRAKDHDGWWYKTREEWREETGMSRWEQEEARKRLRRVGVMREERRGIPARLWYRVDEGQLLALLAKADPPAEPDAGPEGSDPAAAQMEGKPPTGRLEASPPDGGKTANWSATPPPTITETTTETTTTTPNPSSSNERAAEPEPARGSGGVQDENQNPAGDHGTAAPEPNEVKPVSGKEATDERRAELVYPAKLTEREREDIAAQVEPLPAEIAQQMLDVVQSRIRSGQIKTNPAAVLRGIVRKYRADPESFDPSPGFGNAEARRRRAETEARARAEVERRALTREAVQASPIPNAVARQSIASMLRGLRGY